MYAQMQRSAVDFFCTCPFCDLALKRLSKCTLINQLVDYCLSDKIMQLVVCLVNYYYHIRL